jgi:hypothetical protein
MLLVITPSAKARGCAQAIQQVTSEETHVAATSSQALARLRSHEYAAVLIDQAFLETEPVESDLENEGLRALAVFHRDGLHAGRGVRRHHPVDGDSCVADVRWTRHALRLPTGR